MTPHRFLNPAIVVAMLVAPSMSYLLDGPSEIEAAQAVAADLDDAIQSAHITTAKNEVTP